MNDAIAVEQSGNEWAFTVRRNDRIETGTSDTMKEALNHTGKIFNAIEHIEPVKNEYECSY